MGIAVLVLPMREPVFLAKQLATLDQLLGGRLILAYRHRRLSRGVRADLPRASKARTRGKMLDEGIQALRLLFTERRASFEGEYYAFDGIELVSQARPGSVPALHGRQQ